MQQTKLKKKQTNYLGCVNCSNVRNQFSIRIKLLPIGRNLTAHCCMSEKKKLNAHTPYFPALTNSRQRQHTNIRQHKFRLKAARHNNRTMLEAEEGEEHQHQHTNVSKINVVWGKCGPGWKGTTRDYYLCEEQMTNEQYSVAQPLLVREQHRPLDSRSFFAIRLAS